MSEQDTEQAVVAKPESWTNITLRVKGAMTLDEIVTLLGDASDHVVAININDHGMW